MIIVKINLGNWTCMSWRCEFLSVCESICFSYNFHPFQIEKTKEFGLSGDDIRRLVPNVDDSVLESHLRAMIEEYLIIKTGVVSVKFIAAMHSKPWILHSFKMLRVRVRTYPFQVQNQNTQFLLSRLPNFRRYMQYSIIGRPSGKLLGMYVIS